MLRHTAAACTHFAPPSIVASGNDVDNEKMAEDSADRVDDNVESVGISDVLTNEAVPRTSATITVRIIKSFEYRTAKNLVLHSFNLETTTVGALKELARQTILSEAKWKPFRSAQLGTYVPVACYAAYFECSVTHRHYKKVHQSAWCKGEQPPQ